MGQFIYTFFIALYSTGIRVASLWNPKARLWIAGRRNIFVTINSQYPVHNSKPATSNLKLPTSDSQLLWMHCASLGEFEQGRPLLEELKRKHGNLRIVLTFFSPSGYEIMKEYKGADHVFYLPMDSPGNAKRFIDSVKPTLVLWVKYEFWFYYLAELRRRNIPVILVSGIFRGGQPFFKWYGAIWKEMLGSFNHIFVQNESSKELLEGLKSIQHVSVTGDTRFDRVIAIKSEFEPIPFIEEFCGSSKVLVAGSTWEEDEVELLHYVKMHPEMKFIIAPHEIDAENLVDIRKEFPNSVFYSELESASGNAQHWTEQQQKKNILIIDNIGMLSRLYKYATIAYVGGGFGDDGVHNVLEAAVYGKPVVFGPVYEKYDEAVGLLESGGGVSYNNPIGLESILGKFMEDENETQKRGIAAKEFVYSKAGATQRIINYIQENRLLTS